MKTHVIDGVTYAEVKRKAKVGDLVVIIDVNDLNNDGYVNGNVFSIEFISEDLVYTNHPIPITLFPTEFRVLEPLESEEVTVDQSQASPQVIDMLANLARRVTQLESQLRDTQNNVERQAEDLENARHRISNHAMMFGEFDEKVGRLTERIQPKDSEEETVTLPKWWVEILMKHAGGVRP